MQNRAQWLSAENCGAPERACEISAVFISRYPSGVPRLVLYFRSARSIEPSLKLELYPPDVPALLAAFGDLFVDWIGRHVRVRQARAPDVFEEAPPGKIAITSAHELLYGAFRVAPAS
jgi:hypothetical protein